METLYGVLLGLVASPIGVLFSFFALFKSPGKTHQWAPFLVLSLGLLAYAYNPYIEDDLVRYFNRAIEYGSISLDRVFFDASGVNEYDVLTCVYTIWSWCVGQVGAVHLLPMVSIMTVYGVAFYITSDLAKRFQGEKFIPFIVLFQLCMLPLPSLISNVRNVWAFSLVILITYLHTVRHMRGPIVYLLYLVPGFIHSSAFLLIVLRIICKLGNKIIIPFAIFSVALPQVIDFLYGLRSLFSSLGNIGTFINLNILRLYWYIHDTGDTAWAQQVANSSYQYFNRILMVSFAIFISLIIIFWTKKNVDSWYKEFLNFMLLINLSVVSFMWFTVPHFWRVSAASFIGISISMIPLLLNRNRAPIFIKIFYVMLPFYMLGGIVAQFWPIQYIVHPLDWIATFFITDIFTILFDIVSGALL